VRRLALERLGFGLVQACLLVWLVRKFVIQKQVPEQQAARWGDEARQIRPVQAQ
jgi:hypothetical protein